jgi:hypothetical protein
MELFPGKTISGQERPDLSVLLVLLAKLQIIINEFILERSMKRSDMTIEHAKACVADAYKETYIGRITQGLKRFEGVDSASDDPFIQKLNKTTSDKIEGDMQPRGTPQSISVETTPDGNRAIY